MVSGQKGRRWAAGLLAAAAIGAGLAVAPGCKKTTEIKNDDKAGVTGDPWEEAARRLQHKTDVGSCKSALTQLNNDLGARNEVVPGLPADGEKAAAAALVLGPADLDELNARSFTTLDAAYLADCFYLRDAARSLDVKGAPPTHPAEAGFAWVCRQVYVNPWPVPTPGGVQASALPPTYVLRRGSGSGLERAYVFLALLQQAGIDGCLIGPESAGGRPAGYIPHGPDGKPLTGYPRGPFWAVGARVGADVLLFDPWKGVPFPGPDGKGVGTLAQVRANPGQIKAWLDDKAWGVSADEVKAARAFVTVPLSGLSGRMKALDDRLRPATGVKPATPPADVKGRFAAAPPAGPGVDVLFWKPPAADRFAYVRALPTFLPAEEGGRDKAAPGERLFTLYQQSLLPETVRVFAQIQNPHLRSRLIAAAAGPYAAAFLTPPTPRELLQRGQFQEANKLLTGKQTEFTRTLERHERERDAAVTDRLRAFFQKAVGLYEELDRAVRPNPLGPPRPDTDPEVIQARAAVENLWRAEGQAAQLLADTAAAEAGLAEVSYLLALTKHEEAERAQARAERAGGPEAARAKADAAEAWREAANAWGSYEERARNLGGWPGRAEHAKALAARAAALAPKAD